MNSQRSDRLLEALLLWQKDLLPSQTLRNVVRDTIRDADRELLERYELSSGDDESFKAICSELITKLGGNPQASVLGASAATAGELKAVVKTPSQQVQIRKVAPPASPLTAPLAANPEAAFGSDIQIAGPTADQHAQFTAGAAPAPALAAQPALNTMVVDASPGRRQPAELDFEVEFLPDLEEPSENRPFFGFDPIMFFQRIDGMIRFASMDWLSIPRIMALTIIGAVASLPFVIETPALDPDAMNQYGGSTKVGLSEPEAGEATDFLPPDEAGEQSQNEERAGGLAAQKPGEDETSAHKSSSTTATDTVELQADDPYAIFNTERTAEGREVVLQSGEEEEPIDLDSALAPILGESQALLPAIIASMERGDLKIAASQLDQLSSDNAELPWFKAEMALRDRSFASRRDAWLALLTKSETSLTDDLLCARLLLSASPSERERLVASAREKLSSASASKSAARYMRWCLSWSNSRDWATLISQKASRQTERQYVDSIFVAIATYAADDVEAAKKELVDCQVGLQSLRFASSSEVESWVGNVSAQDLSQKVRSTLNSLGRLTRAPR